MNLRIKASLACALGLVACGSGKDGASSASPSAAASVASKPSSAPSTPASATATSATPAPSSAASSASSAAAPQGKAPPDGKYERVSVEGVTVPMIEVMEGGTVVLVDTDGKKPRTWEEQYKRKRDTLGPGSFDIHKVDVNKNNKFDDDPIDKEGLWIIDEKGTITKH